MKIFAALSCAIFLCSCASVQHTSEPKASARFEVITREEQALEAVEATPTEFRIPAETEPLAWQRARLFFARYLGDPNPKERSLTPSGVMLTSGDVGSPYVYKVEKYPTNSGSYNYLVSCSSKAGPSQMDFANLNAKNLARFIADGELELSLLRK